MNSAGTAPRAGKTFWILLTLLFLSFARESRSQALGKDAATRAPAPLTMAQRYPAPGENLKAYKARMEAYFARQIALQGLDKVREEAGEYEAYLRFMRYWEPRLPDGDFEAYFQHERSFYRNRPHPEPSPGQRAASSASALASATVWQEVGPISKPSTHVGAEGTGPIEFITFYNPSPSRMLAGSLPGSLFYSTNGGVTWSKTGADTQIGRSGVGSAVFHPNDYKTWFVSSSGNGSESEPMWIGWTGGVFRTTDEGVTWTQIADQSQLNGITTTIYKLAINPTNPSQLWAATSNGLFVTNSALAAAPTWSAAIPLKSVYDFQIRPGNSQWLYATAADWSGGNLINWQYLYSNDNGTTWQSVPGQAASTAGASQLTIQVSPAKPDNLYCLTIPPGGSSTQLFIYNFGTNFWTLVDGTIFNKTGGKAFGVDPADPNEIFISQSTEGRRYNYQGNPPYIDFHSTYYPGGTYHPDIESLVPHPLNPNEVWMTNHGGAYVSLDNGATWMDRSTGLGVAMVNGMAAEAADPSFVALVTNSAWSNLWSPAWKEFPGSFCDGMLPMIDPGNSQYMWYACQWGAWSRSTDGGLTFSGNGPSSPAFIGSAAFNHLDPKTQYRLSLDSHGQATVMRTFDRGNIWDQIADFAPLFPATTHDYILWKVYTPETNGDYLVAHLLEKPLGSVWWTQNHLYRTKIANDPNAAHVIASWEELPLPDNRWLGDLDFDPANPDVVYISNGSSSIFTSSPTGSAMVFKVDYTHPAAVTAGTCTPGVCLDLTQNLPNGTTGQNDLAVEQGSNGRLYLATDYGVFSSDNASRALGGAGWAPWGTGLPNTGFNGAEVNYRNNKLRVASYGRGLWEADLATGCTEPPPGLSLWLPLDEPAGPTALNAAFITPGTHAGGPIPLAAGKVAGALCFDGINDRVDVPSYLGVNFAGHSFSLDAWVLRKPGGSATQVIVDKRNDSGGQLRGYSLFLSAGQIGLQLADGTFANYLSPSQVPVDGRWHLVAVTVDRGNPAGGRFYLDGQPVGPPFNPTGHPGSLNTAAPFRIGARSALVSSGQVSAVLNGCLDEVEAFSRVLSPDEVLAIYRADANGKCKRGSNLPPLSLFCGTAATVTVSAPICNYQVTPQTFTYALSGLPVQSGCAIPGPTSFTPASGTITVPAGKCVNVPISIVKPAAMTGAGMTSCYRLLVQNSVTGETFTAGGVLDTKNNCNDSSPN
jgi:hypothetical protein